MIASHVNRGDLVRGPDGDEWTVREIDKAGVACTHDDGRQLMVAASDIKLICAVSCPHRTLPEWFAVSP